jgi:hypothetical protein
MTTASALNEAVREMNAIATKYGLKLSTSHVKCGQREASVYARFEVLATDGKTAQSHAAVSQARYEGIDISGWAYYKGTAYRIVDYTASRWKYPWLAERKDGQHIKLSKGLVTNTWPKLAAGHAVAA